VNTTKQTLTTRILRAAALAGALVVAVAALGAAPDAAQAAEPTPAAVEATPVAQTRPELPREWRWERKAVNFDSMYRRR